MTTQKTFKARVRARSARTGESYTAARAQLLRKADTSRTPARADAVAPEPEAVDTKALAGVSAEAMLERTGRPLAEWLAILDASGAGGWTHTEIARSLVTDHGLDGWWAQTVTVGYERARGRRVLHQTTTGFSVGATRTVAATADAVRGMFDDPGRRATWLPDAPLRAKAGYAGKRGRYDWTDPPSKVWVDMVARDERRTTVTVTHERLPGAEAAEATKQMWREALGRLKAAVEVG
jgi:hypothetical protein